VVLIAGGTVLLFLPGPGIATIAAGVALIPGGARKVARARAYIERLRGATVRSR
jgi:Putative transmembrane protein (PGPGW)